MHRENSEYQANLDQILKFTGGRQFLKVSDVKRFTGIADARTVKKRFPIVHNRISAATLARCLSEGEKKT